MRPSTRLAAYALLVLSGVTCTDSPTAPKHSGGMAVLNVVPAFSLLAQRTIQDLGNFGLTVNNIHIHIDHPPAAPFDTVVSIPAGADSITLNLSVILNAPTEVLNVQIELRDGTTVLYSGTQTVTAAVGATGTSTPASVPINYVGPGAGLAHFAIAPRDTAILVTGTVPFRVSATDSTGAAVVGVAVHWAVGTAALGTIDGTTGVFTPAGTAGTTEVIATTPNGLGDSTTVVISAPPARLVLVSGGSQTGAAGAALAEPVVVQAQSATGSAVAGVVVSFAGSSGGATASPAQATTGATGNAQTTVTLGHATGAQSVTATLAGVPNLVIPETATAAVAANIAKVSGDAQADTLGAPLAKPFVVSVTDAFGNSAAGATVTWTRVSGAGALGAPTTATDSTGAASDTYTLGHTAGTDTIAASLAGVPGALVKFTAFGHPVASKIQIVSGNQQAATPGTTLPQPLTVLVTDTAGVPVRGATVQWGLSGPGAVAPASSPTDSTGHAATTLTLGAVAGTYVVTASLANGASVTFLEKAVLPVSDTLHFVTQPSNVASVTYITPSIQVEFLNGAGQRDSLGVGATATVALSVLHGPPGGTVRDSTGFAGDTVHAVKGLATFHVGNDIAGTYKLLATSPVATSDSSAAYTVSVGPARQVHYLAGPGVSIAPCDTTTIRPTVLVTDGGGNPVPGASVTWHVDSGGGSLVDPANPTAPASTLVTTADGSAHAAVFWWLGTSGVQKIRAYVTTASEDTIPFALAVYGPGSQLVFTNLFDTTYASGTQVPVVVQVEDSYGNPVPLAGVPVQVYVGEGCEGECNLLPPGAPSHGLRTPAARPSGARVRGRPVRAPAGARAPMPPPAVSAHGVTAFNYGTAPVFAPMAARARGTAARTGHGAYNAVPFGSGVFPWLPCPPFPTVFGDTVVVTDSTGKAVFTGLNIAGKAYETVYLVAYDTSYEAELYDAYGPDFHLTPGAPYTVTVAYDSVHQAVGNPVIDDPEVAVLDSVGNGVPGVTVNFAVTAGGGSLDSTYAVTDYLGGAAVPGWTLGPASGANTVHASATVGGTPSSADLTAIGHQPGALRMTTDLGSTIADSSIISPELQVAVTDSTGSWDLNAAGIVITPSAVLVPADQDASTPSLIGNTSAVSTSPDGSAGFAGLGLMGSGYSYVAIVFSALGLASVMSAVTQLILP